ncbi:MAG: Isoquinoline 1-oxidoreductase subunit [Burkholderiales bacterium]
MLVLLLAAPAHAQTTTGLAPVSNFDRIAEKDKRAVALFQEAGKVIMHPRCVNCHPADDTPRQGDLMRVHEPPVERGAGGMGASGMRCFTCHGAANFERMPGNPRWFLAPKEMAWIGKSLGQICAQIKDPKRNGGKSLEQIVEHMARDELVGWGWHPSLGRTAVPGTQEQFGALIKAWADSGAACPRP